MRKMSIAINFLIFTYFGIDLNDYDEPFFDDLVLEQSINKAYLDATQQGAFNTLLDNNDLKAKANESHKKAHEHIKKAISSLVKTKETLDCSYNVTFDKWHDGICSKILKDYEGINKDKERFSYGNAQKWVNMSLKNLYIISEIIDFFLDDTREMYRIILDKSDYFHVPVDSYILKAAAKKNNRKKNKYSLEEEIAIKEEKSAECGIEFGYYRETPCKIENYKTKPWSRLSQAEYKEFQKELYKAIAKEGWGSPLMWESVAWIEEAKNKAKRGSKTGEDK